VLNWSEKGCVKLSEKFWCIEKQVHLTMGFFFQFCEVVIVTIIQKMKEPKLAIGKRGQ
jgi:hypothetical protein